MARSSSRPLRVALTGASSGLGALLLPRLLADDGVARVTVVDVQTPDTVHEKLEYRRVDLTHPDSDVALRGTLSEAKVDALFHLAFVWGAGRSPGYAHELEVAGTLRVLNAVAAANIGRLIVPSMTAVYGAQKSAPARLRESAPLMGCPSSRFISDKLEVERQIREFRVAQPDVRITVLRFAPVLGRHVDNPATRLLKGRLVPTVLGFDPPWQAIHEDDAVAALHHALHSQADGEFNVVGAGLLPFSGMVELAGGRVLPLPGPVARTAIRMLSASGMMQFPLALLDYIHYPWVADGALAEGELQFVPKHDVRRAAQALRRSRP